MSVRDLSFELDHFFVASTFGAPEIGVLEEAGFTPAPEHDHPGQGTASRGVFFDNAYLELLWLTDRSAAEAPLIARTGLALRADPASTASPFGFGLRWPEGRVPPPPFRAWRYSPPYVPEGLAFAMGVNSEALGEPLLFVLPFSRTANWETPEHANGARSVTGVSVASPDAPRSAELSAFFEMGLVDMVTADEPLLAVELDRGRSGAELDLRPGLPLTLRW